MIGEQIKTVSANCQGLRDNVKDLMSVTILTILKLNPNILCLQDTHLTKHDDNDLNLMTNCKCLLSRTRTDYRWVAILI